MTPEKIKNKKLRICSLRSRLLIAFLAFTVLVLAILWLFQTVLLNNIYRTLKLRAIDRCADTALASVSDNYDKNALSPLVTDLAKKYAMCISVYEIHDSPFGKSGNLVIDRHTNMLCLIHNLRDSSWLNRLYREAVQNGGERKEWISLADLFGNNNEDIVESGTNVVLARVVRSGEQELLFLFNCELVPVSATVNTIRVSLLLISVVLIALSVILAFVLSERISRPIREMSKEATKLALGEYNVCFDGGSMTEIRTLSSTLNRAADELSKLDKMQKDLIANVSHDLRTPLTMIAGYTEAMRDLPGEATAENMQIVIDETKRLSDLVNDMMEVSQYQGGEQTLKRSTFNFTDVVRTTLERYSRLREKDGYSITFEAERDVFVTADEGRILQVIYNLVNNAINYTGEDKTVLIRQTAANGKVTLEVTDTGCGIPEKDLPLVWERYYKVHDFHKRENTGTGLGLSIVKNILLLHGAQFGVRSTVGKGSTFWFTLSETQ